MIGRTQILGRNGQGTGRTPLRALVRAQKKGGEQSRRPAAGMAAIARSMAAALLRRGASRFTAS